MTGLSFGGTGAGEFTGVSGTNGGSSSALGFTVGGGLGGRSADGSKDGGGSGSPQSAAGGAGWRAGSGDGAAGGGGGGANAAGSNGGTNSVGGNGGAGIASPISGSSTTYAGGGGGGSEYTGSGSTSAGVGGAGGGGNGGLGADSAGKNGGNATFFGGGGGGGGGFSGAGGNAAGGVVILRYFGDPLATGGTITTGTGLATGYTLHTFSTAGTSQFTIDGAAAGPKLSGGLSGTGGFTWNSTSTLTLMGANIYQGDTIISAGTLQAGDGGTSGSLGSGAITNNAALVIDRSNDYSISAAIAGTGRLTKLGAGTLTLSGINTYSGLTTISAGRLIGSAASLAGAIANAAELEFAQPSAGSFSSAITGAGSLTKTGGGNLILSGSSAYSGATSVAAGRLSVDGILGDSPIAVLAAAELGGSGSIAGSVSVAAGGTLSPGNSIASLATGTASFAAAATFAYEVDSTDPLSLGAAADLLVVSGNLDLDPGNGTLLTFTDLSNTPAPFVEDTTIFALINYSGPWNGGLFTYGGNVLADGSQFSVGSQRWEIDYNRTSSAGLDNFTADYLPSSSFVTVMAVPEPSTLALAVLVAGLTAVAARRRR